jgi:hypothetical protein
MESNPLLVKPNQVLPATAGPERGKKIRSKRRKHAGGQGRKKGGIVDSKNHVSDKIIDDFTHGGNDLITYDDKNLKKYCSDMYRANLTRSPKLLHNFKTKARLNFETRNLEVKPPVGEPKLDPFDHQVHKEIALYYKGLGDIIAHVVSTKHEKQSKMKSLHTLVVQKIDALYRDQKAKKAQKKAAKKAKPRKRKVVASIESNENKEEAEDTDVDEDDVNKLIVKEKLSETESVHQHGGGEEEGEKEKNEDSAESEDEEVQVLPEIDDDSEESETEPVEEVKTEPDEDAMISEKLAKWMKHPHKEKEEVKQPESSYDHSHLFDYTHHSDSSHRMI